MNRLHLYILTLILICTGTALFLYKVFAFGFPLLPGDQGQVYLVEVHIGFTAQDKPVNIRMYVPRQGILHRVVNENFISRAFGMHIKKSADNRWVNWSIRRAKGSQHLYYTATVTAGNGVPLIASKAPSTTASPPWKGSKKAAAESIVTEARNRSTDADNLTIEVLKQLNLNPASDEVALLLGPKPLLERKVALAVDLLALAGVYARTVHGIKLEAQRQNASLEHWLEIFHNGHWSAFNVATAEKGMGSAYLAWWRGEEPFLKVKGASNVTADFSVVASRQLALQAAVDAGRAKHPLFVTFSLFGLPLESQAVYQILLLVPVGALVMVLMRNVVGIRTFGTFMPVLIALAFRETRLIWGMVLFTTLVALGLSVRLYLEHLKLLVVPRLAAILTVVVILMLTFSMITHKLGLERGLSVALFPMVIMAMTIERMSVVWDESGPLDALRQGVGTLMVSALVYLIMGISLIGHLVFTFPELLLVVLAVILLLGRYTGYRLMELMRFKALRRGNPDHAV